MNGWTAIALFVFLPFVVLGAVIWDHIGDRVIAYFDEVIEAKAIWDGDVIAYITWGDTCAHVSESSGVRPLPPATR